MTKNTTEEYGEKPKLYEVLAGTVDSAFVRFDTYEHGVVQPKVWEDQEVFDSFIGYYESTYLRSLKKTSVMFPEIENIGRKTSQRNKKVRR